MNKITVDRQAYKRVVETEYRQLVMMGLLPDEAQRMAEERISAAFDCFDDDEPAEPQPPSRANPSKTG